MKAKQLKIPEVILLEPKVFSDDRGFFYESFNQEQFTKITGLDINFVQDNHSKSSFNVLRGLHFQAPPKQQGKLVRVIQGEIFDVAVDIRPESPSYGQWVSEILSAENKRQLWIPAGFAHGFLTLSRTAEIVYKASQFYAPEHDYTILWNDPQLGIDWPYTDTPILSTKDSIGIKLEKLAII